jgi:mRNA-degrading endonuclease toxin of MazEF toxin-antitoxin module
MRPARGSVVLIRVPFHQARGSKIRPALVVLDCGDDDFIAAPITSHPSRSGSDVELKDWLAAGLNVASTVRLDKIGVLAKTDVLKSVGDVSDRDSKCCGEALCRLYCWE